MSEKRVVVALAGNPNCGKTTLFNNLTGMRQHVGNWPGKTVAIERKDGKATYDGTTLEIVDLPGTYSLSSRSLEEEIAVEYLLTEKPDVVVNIIDAAHLERNLYLTLQL
ncbi:MAG TPA: 50S ribosome-binding GTPase, partial [Methanocorpusculum sp.]|nr:50S ribosome-binding GTPase [Methanocorpusculum sp.]